MRDFVKDIALNIKTNADEVLNKLDSAQTKIKSGLEDIKDATETEKKTLSELERFQQTYSDELNNQLKKKKELVDMEDELRRLQGINTKEAKERAAVAEREVRIKKAELGLSDSFGEQFSSGFTERLTAGIPSSGAEWGSYAAAKLKKVADDAWEKLKDVLRNAWQELGNMLNFSRLTQSQTRELAFGYGLNASQAYGMSQAMSLTGISSIEDLAYANPTERKLFTDAFKKYTEKYNELADSGFFDSMLEYQVEMEEFKQDLKLEVVEFFMENKDLIKTGMKAIMTLAKGALEFFNKVIKILTGETGRSESERVQAASDIVGSYTNNRTVNVKMDYSFTNTTAADRQAILNSMQQPLNGMISALNAE